MLKRPLSRQREKALRGQQVSMLFNFPMTAGQPRSDPARARQAGCTTLAVGVIIGNTVRVVTGIELSASFSMLPRVNDMRDESYP